MGLVTKTKTWADNEGVNHTDINANYDTLYTLVNGNLDNDNIDSSAGISPSKISGTAATLTGSETLTNKTLTKPTINGSTQAYTSDSDGSTITFNMAASNVHTVTLGGNRTLAVSNVSVGQSFVLRLVQDATGSRTVTWFSTIKWPGGSAPTLSTTANKVDTFGFICTSSNNYDGYVIGKGLS